MSIQGHLAGIIEANRISGLTSYGGYQYRDVPDNRPNPLFEKMKEEAKNANETKK